MLTRATTSVVSKQDPVSLKPFVFGAIRVFTFGIPDPILFGLLILTARSAATI